MVDGEKAGSETALEGASFVLRGSFIQDAPVQRELRIGVLLGDVRVWWVTWEVPCWDMAWTAAKPGAPPAWTQAARPELKWASAVLGPAATPLMPPARDSVDRIPSQVPD